MNFFSLAYNKQDTLDGFLQRLFDLDQTINSCDTGKTEGFKMEVATTSRNHPDGAQFTTQKYSITLNNTDLEYAAATDTPIWPAIVRKTVEAIQNDQNTVRLLRGRNNTHTDGLFDCIDHGVPSTKRQKEKRLYLCKLSDIVTRITGVQLRTSDKIMEGPESDHVGELLDKAEKHLVIVFENWAPKYLVRSNDRPTNHFTAVKLDVKKRGESHDMFFDLKSWTPADVFAYKDIIDHYGGEEKDVHIVYTFPS